jgi:hydroxymethylbilane synthase
VQLLLATRGSPLALWQARAAQGLLGGASHAAELAIVESTGDRDAHTDLAALGRTGVFTAEIDAAVLTGRAHVGVHSLKDMPTTLPAGLVLAAVLPRGPFEDALVSSAGTKLATLPAGARVATGSVRRIAMLRNARPDLDVVAIRGNVDTRVAKLASGHADALILARAGLERLGLAHHVAEILGPPRFLPAVGQGIVGLTCRADDRATREILERIGDPATFAAAQAERALLARLHGGCNAPVGALARVENGELALTARVLSLDGRTALEDVLHGPAARADELGAELAERLAARGAAELIESARRQR